MTRKSRPLRDARCSRGTRWLSLVLALSLVVASVPNGLAYSVDQFGPASGVETAEPTPADLQQLVAPIALYPDELIAQVLAAATYPEEIVEADRWIQQHSSLQGPELAKEVDAQPWDESASRSSRIPPSTAHRA